MKEYCRRELSDLFRRTGFRRVVFRVGLLGHWVPRPLLFALEAVLDSVPESWRPTLCQNALVGRLLGICLRLQTRSGCVSRSGSRREWS
jgi:hypothetical protein